MKPLALYHEVRRRDSWEQAAREVHTLIQTAARERPGLPRHLFIDVEGHRLPNRAFEPDFFENFLNGYLVEVAMVYLTEMSTPMFKLVNPKGQEDEVPDLLITGGEDVVVSFA